MSPHRPAPRARRRLLPALAAAALTPLIAAGLAVVPATAQAAPTRPSVPEDPSSTHEVTLVTGDVVTVTTMTGGKQVADVDRPDDAVGGVRMQEVGGDLFVIPDQAVALLGTDRLDRRLFNVTDLIEMGYDDANVGAVPTIVEYSGRARAVAAPAPKGSTLVRRLPAIDGAALSTRKPQARTFWNAVAPEQRADGPHATLTAGVEKLWLDGRVEASLKESVPQVGAPEAWAAGYDGTGVTVAVLDTGIDGNPPDLAGQVDGTRSFVPGEEVTDVNGHGTHVASTIAGTGAASGGDFKGVAPGAHLIVGKVLGGAEGYGQDSWVMAGMQWAAESGAEVVSMSLGDSFASDGSDPVSQTVDTLSEDHGTLFVIAAGNAGPESISAPGAAASALTVGAVDKQDSLAGFSSTGPLAVSGAIKPDIAAPGVDITAARSQEMPSGEGMYQTMSGTSMATPHVSGAAAIIAQQHPGWTGQQVKEKLMSSAKALADGYSPYEIGTGRLDVAAAVKRSVRATGSLFFGNYDWPHEPTDTAVTKDLTFTNEGDTDVTLDLALAGGDAAYSLGADTVTVPAGGKETVSVTGDPTAVGPGRHVGYVVGTDAATGDPLTRTAVGLVKEEERYDLTVRLVDREGEPAAGWVGFGLAGDPWPWAEYVDGERTLRMPRGTYQVAATLDVSGEESDRSGVAVMVDPETVLDESAEVVLDARDARLLQTEAPQRTEDRQRKVDFSIVDSTGVEYRSAYAVPASYDDVYVSPTDPVSSGSFVLTTRWRKGEPMFGLGTADGRLSFETLPQPGSALRTRSASVPTVYAGTGAPADYDGLDAQGKLVVVHRSDAVSPEARAQAAAQAGATALVVVNDGVGGLFEYVGESPIPVASVHRDEGRKLVLLARGGLRLKLDLDAYADYVYDLTRDYPDRVPDRPLVYQPELHDLARIDARYYGVRSGEGSGYRYDLTLTPALGFREREWHPGTRVEWVTPDQVWVEGHAQNIYGALPWDMVSAENTYPQGRTTRLDWFRPGIRPAFSPAFAVENSRWQDYMTWNVQPWSSNSDVMRLGGYLPWGETPTHLQVFQGGTKIHDNPYSADMQWKDVPAGDKPYRVVLDARRPGDVFGLSTRTHTEWTFRSDTVDGDDFEPFSVMQLDYRLDTDLRGDVAKGRTHRIALRSIASGTPRLPGKVTRVTLGVSFDDGRSYRSVALTKDADGWWQGRFTAPRSASAFVSVRASASMTSGYSIRQEVLRAYGVR